MSFGFARYVLREAAGEAIFMTKPLRFGKDGIGI
jgi:hypothetical protein